MDECVWSTGGIKLMGANQVLREKLSKYQFIHHQCNMYWPGFRPWPPLWQVSKWLPDPWHSLTPCQLKHHSESMHHRSSLDLQNCYELSAHPAALPANHDTWRHDRPPWLPHTLGRFSTTSSSHTSCNRNQHGSLWRPTTQVHTTPIIHHCDWSKVSQQHTLNKAGTKFPPSQPATASVVCQHGTADEYDVGMEAL